MFKNHDLTIFAFFCVQNFELDPDVTIINDRGLDEANYFTT